MSFLLTTAVDTVVQTQYSVHVCVRDGKSSIERERKTE